jgi:hypothetical protein
MGTPPSDGMKKIESDPSKLARLCISLPRDLYKQVKMKAHDEDTTISALMIQIIRSNIKS